MIEYILLMHADEAREVLDEAWEPYLRKLREGGFFRGGSAIGGG